MITTIFRYCLLYTALTWLFSCANVIAPNGGVKDDNPPIVQKTNPDNYSTNFSSKQLSIEFDEYIQLKEANRQIIVTPTLSSPPDIKAKGKQLVITFKDSLAANTTYTFNFGQAIRDLNEGNVLDNFKYVFSTGSFLDSLNLSGQVMDAFNYTPTENAVVILYQTTNDSAIYNSPPHYLAFTDKNGKFSMDNLKEGKYQLFALVDENYNYLYDLPSEKIAFHNSILSLDSGKTTIALKLFEEQPVKKQSLIEVLDNPGCATFIYAQPVNDFSLQLLNKQFLANKYIEFSEQRDTIKYWYLNKHAENIDFIIQQDTAKQYISLSARPFNNDTAKQHFTRVSLSNNQYNKALTLKPNVKSIKVKLSRPIKILDTARIVTFLDSTKRIYPRIDFFDEIRRTLNVTFPWEEGKSYTIKILPSALTDIYGIKNDSISITLKIASEAELSELLLNFTDTLRINNPVLQLIDNQNNIVSQLILSDKSSIRFELLKPAEYVIKVFFDINNNGVWDSGNLPNKIQPEKTYIYPQKITLRPNWETELAITY